MFPQVGDVWNGIFVTGGGCFLLIFLALLAGEERARRWIALLLGLLAGWMWTAGYAALIWQPSQRWAGESGTFRVELTEPALGHGSYGEAWGLLTRVNGVDCRQKVKIYLTDGSPVGEPGDVLTLQGTLRAARRDSRADRSLLNMKDIWDFAETANLQDVADLLERQIRYNNAIAEEGLLGDYGANIGRVLLSTYGNDVSIRAKAKAAAGSDARMNGCELPVIINSGSGNQGITCSVPLIEYAKELHSGKEKLYRALIISNLVAIHEKTGIGTLSAYCGAVSAGAGAGAGIVYLCGDGYQAAIHTVVNALAIVSGIVCDDAKASCAAKIASSVDAALLGYNMYKCHQEFKGGDGIVMKDIETTIKGIGRLGKVGMKETNEEIIRLMIE